MKTKILLLIPARMGSSRFPGKPLVKIINKTPMIGYIYKKVKSSKIIDHCYVATCDKQISDYIQSINGKFIMTSKKHKRASERCSEALRKLEKKLMIKFDIVTMLQGDEPLISLSMIEKGIIPLINDKKILVTNLAAKIYDKKEFWIKIALRLFLIKIMMHSCFQETQYLLKKLQKKFGYKQVCSISFRRNFLIEYLEMNETPLEKLESIDMLRILENGYKIKIVIISGKIQSVDTKQDLIKVNKILKNFK